MVDFANGIINTIPPNATFTRDELIGIVAVACQEAYDRAVAESVRLNELRLETAVNMIENLVNDRLASLAQSFEQRLTENPNE